MARDWEDVLLSLSLSQIATVKGGVWFSFRLGIGVVGDASQTQTHYH